MIFEEHSVQFDQPYCLPKANKYSYATLREQKSNRTGIFQCRENFNPQLAVANAAKTTHTTLGYCISASMSRGQLLGKLPNLHQFNVTV